MLKIALFSVSLFFAMMVTSCAKDEGTYDREAQLQLDIDSIQRFVSINKISAKNDGTGLFTQILSPGTGEKNWANVESVTVLYTGRLLNGATFDKPSLPVPLLYSGLLQAWKNGLKQIQEGGSVRLIIPSTMAYTDVQVGIIAPNSNLDYTIELLKIDTIVTKTEIKQP
jgi:FKBP-type peptidyl-prolyl cis-trans isomerase FkpA